MSEIFLPGASIRAVAIRHDVAESTIRSWRGQAMRGELGPVPGVPPAPAVVPVVVDEGGVPSTSAPVAASNAASRRSGRRWPFFDKVRIVAESFAPGGSMRSVAARHGVSLSTLTDWRNQARQGKLGPIPEVAAPTAGTPAADIAVPSAPRIDGPAPSPSVTVEAGEVVVRLPWDCPAERIVAVASGLRQAR